MQLKELTNKEIVVGKTRKGYCRGVALSLKSYAVKYLLCSTTLGGEADFALSVNSIKEIGEQILLTSARPLLPKNSAKVFIGRPVYSAEGVYLGKIIDLSLRDFTATYLFTDQEDVYPVNAVVASQDALLLKKEQPFPLGSRIPAPLLFLYTDKKDGLVTKPVLRTAMGQGTLVRLTLALSPFCVEL